MDIKDIINYKIKVKNINKNKALKVLIYFFIVMFALTLLSRFSDSLTIPRVKTTNASMQSINNNLTIQGEIVESKEINISTIPDIKVESVNVSSSKKVQKGDVLVELNIDQINKKISEVESEIESNTKVYTRAVEDYNLAKKQIDENINKLNKTVNDLKAQLDSTSAPDAREELKIQYDQAKEEYDTAVNSKEQELLAASRQVEDSEVGSKNDKLNEDIEILRELKNNDGKIIASANGYITSVDIQSGSITTEAAIITMADESSDYKFTGQITKDQRKLIKVGCEVELSFENSYDNITGLTVESISINPEDKTVYDVEVRVPSSKAEIGESAKVKTVNDEGASMLAIPLEALRQEGNNFYILVISDRDTVLGEEQYAEKIPVEILKKDDKYAAIKDFTITTEQDIITETNKLVEAGDRVRKENK